jgi:phospholipase C
MSRSDPSDARLDHLVVLMFENHSFDSLLGYLYDPSEAPEFEGVAGRALSNPVPADVVGEDASAVAVHPSTGMTTPYPDPGEEFPHVNTQLFGGVAPESNRFAEIDQMRAPFNAPSLASPSVPTMDGFVQDFVNQFRVSRGKLPGPAEYGQIMASYTPDQLPVLSTLARRFACFDHWFCDVPTQTYPNRSFFHAATSSGFVLNSHPPGKFALHNAAPTIFNRLEADGKSWAVYIDPLQILPATGLIHARALEPYFPTNFRTIFDFYYESGHGSLPNYAFLEPNMFHPHTDMHPHSGSKLADDLHVPVPDNILGGEQLLADVYNALRTAPDSGGSTWKNTAFLVTFDEHGGTFDHVPPPSAVPPDDAPGEMGFAFDRLGVRVPSVLISPWVGSGAIVHEVYRGTSVIRTLIDWWGLGPPLTRRDQDAPSLLPLLARSSPIAPRDWPLVAPRKPGPLGRAEQELARRIEALDAPMEKLEQDLLGDALAHEARVTGAAPAADAGQVSHREAHEHLRRIGSKYFPGVANGRQE